MLLDHSLESIGKLKLSGPVVSHLFELSHPLGNFFTWLLFVLFFRKHKNSIEVDVELLELAAVSLSLRETNQDESINWGKSLSILFLLENKAVNRNVFNDFLFFRLSKTKLFKVITSLKSLLSLLGTCCLGIGSFFCGFSCCFFNLLLGLFLCNMSLHFFSIPLFVSVTVLLGRRRVFDSERHSEELHDPRKELPRGHRFAFFDVIKLLLAHRYHAWAFVCDVVRQFHWHLHDLSEFLLYNCLKVNDSPSIELLELFSLSSNSDTTRSHHEQTEVGWHLRGILQVESWLFYELLEVFLVLENKDVFTIISGKFGHTLFNLAALERDWVNSLPKTPLTGKEELLRVLIKSSCQQLFKAASTIFNDMANWTKGLSTIRLHADHNSLKKLSWGHAGNINLDIGVVEELDDELVEDVALTHVEVLNFTVELSLVIGTSLD